MNGNKMLFGRRFWTGVAAVALASAWAGCSANGGGIGDASGGSSQSGGGSGGSHSGVSGTGGGAGGEGGGQVLIEAGPSDGSLSEASACAAQSYPGQLVPMDLHVMLDQSGSMKDDGKWQAVLMALKKFFGAKESAGIGVSLNYFPLPPTQPIPGACNGDPDCGLYGPCLNMGVAKVCSGSLSQDTSCDGNDYGKPEVPVGELPSYKSTLEKSLDTHSPTGDATPTNPAMMGVVGYATKWAAAHPAHLTYIVFATDGEPTGCTYSGGINEAAKVAQWGATQKPPAKTFVIGVGSELGALNTIATAGGTDKAYIVDTGSSVTDQFIKVLNEIRAAGACKFQIPVPDSGQPDYDRVNVAYTDPPDAPVDLKYVTDPSKCDPKEGGWYYDNPQDPQMIILCSETCDMVQLGDGDISVLLGCDTITL